MFESLVSVLWQHQQERTRHLCEGDVGGERRQNPPRPCAPCLFFTTSDLVGDGGKSGCAPQQVLPVIGWARLAGSGYQRPLSPPDTRPRYLRGDAACVRARKVRFAPANERRKKTHPQEIACVQRQKADTENYPQLKVL